MIEAQVSRRDVLKFSALGAAAVALPARAGRPCQDGEPDRGQQAAGAVHAAFAVPPVIDKGQGAVSPRRTARSSSRSSCRAGFLDDPTFETNVFAYSGQRPRPDDPRPARHAARRSCRSTSCRRHTRSCGYDPWTSTHLHGSASKPQYDGYASDITEPGPDQELRLPEQPGRPDALVPRPRRAPHRRERLHGPGRAVPPARRRRGAEHPERCATPGTGDQYDLPLILADKMFSANGEFLLRRRRPHGPVGRRRPGQRRAVAEPQGRASASTASGSSTPRSPAATGCS